MNRRPVLVTGSNRSGTTWVGRMLCASGAFTYVHEPFNPGRQPRLFPWPVPFRNLYVCDDNEHRYAQAVEALIDHRFPLRAQAFDALSPRHVGRLGREVLRSVDHRLHRRPVLLKDPIAVFAAKWLAERFDLGVVAMVRNPVAYAGSIKRLHWGFDFRNWLDQPLLMRDVLEPLAPEIAAAAAHTPDLIAQACLQWNATYLAIDRFRADHPEWLVVDHDALAGDPLVGFDALYRALGLPFDDRARRHVARASSPDNPSEVAAADKGGIRRDSRASRDTWRHRLEPGEVARVRDLTAEVAARFGAPEAGAILVGGAAREP